jgi:hypothetical protein
VQIHGEIWATRKAVLCPQKRVKIPEPVSRGQFDPLKLRFARAAKSFFKSTLRPLLS